MARAPEPHLIVIRLHEMQIFENPRAKNAAHYATPGGGSPEIGRRPPMFKSGVAFSFEAGAIQSWS